MFVDQIFTKYDTDNDGTIDFKVGSQNYVKVHRSKVASVHNVPGPRSLCWPPTLTRTPTRPRRSCGGLSKFTTRIHRVSWKHGNRQTINTLMFTIAGTIDCKELKEIVGNLYESEGYSQVVLSVALSRLITVMILLCDIRYTSQTIRGLLSVNRHQLHVVRYVLHLPIALSPCRNPSMITWL